MTRKRTPFLLTGLLSLSVWSAPVLAQDNSAAPAGPPPAATPAPAVAAPEVTPEAAAAPAAAPAAPKKKGGAGRRWG